MDLLHGGFLGEVVSRWKIFRPVGKTAPGNTAHSRVFIGEEGGQGCRHPIAARHGQRRFPGKVPRDQGALPRIAAPGKPDAFRQLLLIRREFRQGLLVPGLKVRRTPLQRTVQVTEVTGIRPARAEIRLDVGIADLMTSDRLQHTVRCVRHVAVVAITARGCREVMCVCCECRGVTEFFVALRARTRVGSIAGELIVGIAFVDGMARNTTELAALVAGRFNQAVVFTSTHTHHPVGPEKVRENVRILAQEFGECRGAIGFHATDDGGGRLQIGARAVSEALFCPGFIVANPLHGMAKAANLCRTLGGEFSGMNNLGEQNFRRRFVQFAGEVARLDMLLARAMAGFTGDAEFSHMRVDSPGDGIETWFRSCRMTAGTYGVPHLGAMDEIGRAYEGGVSRNPPFLRDQPGEWEPQLGIALARRDPEHLHVMGTGHKSQLDLDGLGHGRARAGRRDMLHVDAELIGALPKCESGVVVGENDIVKIRLDRSHDGELCHGAMKTAVPAGVLVLMAVAAAIGSDVPFDPALLGQKAFGGWLGIRGIGSAAGYPGIRGAARVCGVLRGLRTAGHPDAEKQQQPCVEGMKAVHRSSMQQVGTEGNEKWALGGIQRVSSERDAF